MPRPTKNIKLVCKNIKLAYFRNLWPEGSGWWTWLLRPSPESVKQCQWEDVNQNNFNEKHIQCHELEETYLPFSLFRGLLAPLTNFPSVSSQVKWTFCLLPSFAGRISSHLITFCCVIVSISIVSSTNSIQILQDNTNYLDSTVRSLCCTFPLTLNFCDQQIQEY